MESTKFKLGSMDQIEKMANQKIYNYEKTSETYTKYYSEGVTYRLRKLKQSLNINRIQILSETNHPENLIQFKINDEIFLTDDRELEKLIEFLKFLHNK